MRVSLGWRAYRLMGNIHPPHGGNAAADGFTAVDGLPSTRVEGCPDADLLEHAEGRRRRHRRTPQRVDLARVVQGEGGCARGTAGTGTTQELGKGLHMDLVILEVRVATAGRIACASTAQRRDTRGIERHGEQVAEPWQGGGPGALHRLNQPAWFPVRDLHTGRRWGCRHTAR